MTKRSSSVTIREVAKQARVSVATVSRFINQNAPVSDELSERIQQVMDKLNYVPHAAARQLATRKTRTIGVLLTNMNSDFFAPLFSGIENISRQNEYNMLVATYRPDLRKAYQPPIGPHNADGLLVFADSLDDDQLVQLCQRDFPMVLIHRTPPDGYDIPFVTIENKSAAYKLVEHLIVAHGKRRIVYMRGPENQEDSQWREIGYRAALEQYGLGYREELILWGEFERETAYAAMNEALMDRNLEFDAVFAGDDDSAIGVFRALDEVGLRVPEDIAVVGFDDLRLAAYLNPPLTTVRAPTEEVGRMAAQQLFSLLDGKSSETVTLLPTEIILRQSCGCAYENKTVSA
ncbi:MAG: LacI family DNA-binding transcriptional regulator [Anaerolineales bacterium]|nr:LacI family DNA-binding transcriptional regulator [Anaerolineales bacterium]